MRIRSMICLGLVATSAHAADESVAILQAVAKDCPPPRCEARLGAVMEGKYAKVILVNKTGVGEPADFGYLKKAGNRWLLVDIGTGITPDNLIESGFPAHVANELSPFGDAFPKVIESQLLDALRLKAGTSQRLAKPGVAIQYYVKYGLINRKPNARMDYTDYYLLNKPVNLMGHELVMIENEYVTRWIGCCPNPGLGVTVRTLGSTGNLQSFANANRCKFSPNANLQQELNAVNLRYPVSRGNYASLSCREHD